ncbi:6967_t:CDS:1, partial [Racocetra persica]
MPHLTKVRRSCKNARLAKVSKPNKPIQQQIPTFQLIPIKNNSLNLLEIENSVNQQQTSTSQLTALRIERIRKDLITKINYLSEKELIASSQLFSNIVYKTGIYKGKILSSYLQKKAVELIYASQGKSNSNFQETIKSLKAENLKLTKKLDHLTHKIESLTQKLRYFKRSKNKHISKIRSV